jgi:hypothetical protein
MKHATSLLSLLALLAAGAHAGTYTWTGAAGTSDYAIAGNWDPSGVPGEGDDVIIDGVAVTKAGTQRIPRTLTLLNGASVTLDDGEIQFGNNNIDPVIYGGTVSGKLVAGQYNGASLTISDATIIDTGTGYNGFYQNGGSYLNFVDGAARAAKFNYKTSINADPYWFFSNSGTPFIRYDDQIISRAEFEANFQYVANQDGTTTVSMKALAGWRLGSLSVGEVANGRVSVSVTATKHSGNASVTVYFAQGNHDYGESFAAWPTKTAGVELSASGTVQDTLSLNDGNNCIRAFLLCEGDYTASAPVFRRILAYGDYGTLTDVYEYIGTDDNLADPANWAKDKAAPAPNAPTAGTDIRWFGKNTDYSGVLPITDKDRFDGATLTLSGDCNVSSDVVFSNSTVSIATIVLSAPVVFSLYGTDLTTTRADQWLGVYPPTTYSGAQDKRFVNFLSGKASSFTFVGSTAGVSDNASAKMALVTPGYLVLDGAAITDEQWGTYFDVAVSGTAVTVSYNPTVANNRIASVEASGVTSASATLTATITSIEADASLYVACDTDEITEQNIVEKGTVVVPAGGTASTMVSNLAPFCLHHFAFAIVKDGAVVAFRSGTFFASEFKYVWRNGVWLGATPGSLRTDDSVLILSPYDYGTADISVMNTVVSNATLTSGTLAGQGTMKVVSSAIVNPKQNDTGAICGTWGGASGSPYMDFSSSSGNGTIRRACSYKFNATEGWLENAYTLLFGEERIHLNGTKVGEAMFGASFTLVTNSVAETGDTPYNVTLTYWEPFPERTVRDWTIEEGARVKLARNVSLGDVTVESNDVSIDLNGFALRAESMTTNGVPLKGKYTAATLGILKGEGLLEVGIRPTVIVVR